MLVNYYVDGKTIPDGTPIKGANPYATIEAALEGARTLMSLGAATAWIVDGNHEVVKSEEEVRRVLSRSPSRRG
jgi:hypothetical protein